ncbi:hypothetical protein ACFWA9_23405 [Kitasatospora sp. NPDC059973]|uniref:hypothetical protein n=1 Tax=unclassified Kitasatospora TaxID=2633591 RepID=UPI0033213127
MSEPWSEAPAAPQSPSDPAGSAAARPTGAATPKSLLEQMQELLASVTADLADLQSSGARRTSPSGYPTGTDTSGAPAGPGTR